MAASLDFTSAIVCQGGGHYNLNLSLTVDGNTRTRAVSLDRDNLAVPLTDDDLESFVKVVLKIIRSQNPPNLRQAILNKIVDLGV